LNDEIKRNNQLKNLIEAKKITIKIIRIKPNRKKIKKNGIIKKKIKNHLN
jgi:hypothetical protein